MRISPISWIHIAFTGRYSFKGSSNAIINIDEMIEKLSQQIKSWENEFSQNHISKQTAKLLALEEFEI
ncbi:hypothetical protein L3V86_09500 [Thiotrichales bacterium 19S11-10]|nr:hypothetical protein [Thiotrichales bacterium 19S11-10]